MGSWVDAAKAGLVTAQVAGNVLGGPGQAALEQQYLDIQAPSEAQITAQTEENWLGSELADHSMNPAPGPDLAAGGGL